MSDVGLALTQIAALWSMGFSEFEIFPGLTGPVGTLHPRLWTPWAGVRAPLVIWEAVACTAARSRS